MKRLSSEQQAEKMYNNVKVNVYKDWQSDSTMTQGEREVLNEILARKSNVLKNLIDEMENDSWRIKLRRWLSVKKWVLVCRTRFIWDLTYNKNIFKNKKEKYYKNTYEK